MVRKNLQFKTRPFSSKFGVSSSGVHAGSPDGSSDGGPVLLFVVSEIVEVPSSAPKVGTEEGRSDLLDDTFGGGLLGT